MIQGVEADILRNAWPVPKGSSLDSNIHSNGLRSQCCGGLERVFGKYSRCNARFETILNGLGILSLVSKIVSPLPHRTEVLSWLVDFNSK